MSVDQSTAINAENNRKSCPMSPEKNINIIMNNLVIYAEKLNDFRERLDSFRQRQNRVMFKMFACFVVILVLKWMPIVYSPSFMLLLSVVALAFCLWFSFLLLQIRGDQKPFVRFSKHIYWVTKDLDQLSSQTFDHSRERMNLTQILVFRLRLIELETGMSEMERLLKKTDPHFLEEDRLRAMGAPVERVFGKSNEPTNTPVDNAGFTASNPPFAPQGTRH